MFEHRFGAGSESLAPCSYAELVKDCEGLATVSRMLVLLDES